MTEEDRSERISLVAVLSAQMGELKEGMQHGFTDLATRLDKHDARITSLEKFETRLEERYRSEADNADRQVSTRTFVLGVLGLIVTIVIMLATVTALAIHP